MRYRETDTAREAACYVYLAAALQMHVWQGHSPWRHKSRSAGVKSRGGMGRVHEGCGCIVISCLFVCIYGVCKSSGECDNGSSLYYILYWVFV